MKKYLTILPFCAAVAIGMPASGFAQTATTEAPATDSAATDSTSTDSAASGTTAPTAPAPKAADVESQLSMGEDAEANTEMGKPYTKEVVGAFEMRCMKTEGAQDPCQMYQLMDDGQGAPVAEFSLFRLPAGGKAEAGATLVVPLETALPAQLTVSIDGGKARRYPYAFCNPVGCYVRMGLTPADVQAFKKGKEAVITIVPALAPDQKVDLALSLDGFTASYDKSSVIEQ